MPKEAGLPSILKLSDVLTPINAIALADSLQFVFFSNLNSWAANGFGKYNWVNAPHGRGGAIKRNGHFYNYPIRQPTTSGELVAVGGQVGYADGSVIWKRIDRMCEKYWTYPGDGGHRGAW